MRALTVACLAALVGLMPQRAADPFISVGVVYGGPGVQAPEVAREHWNDVDAWRRDLQAIRGLGFNSITTWTNWAHAEPIRGRYRFDALEQMLRLAGEAGLRVTVRVLEEPAPEWLKGPACSAGSPLAAMVAAAAATAAKHEAFEDLVSPVALGSSGCERRPVVMPKPAGQPPMTAAELGAVLDLMRADPGPGGWRLDLQAAQDAAGERRGPEVTDADLRLWAWAALARGARGISFDSWDRMIDEAGRPNRAAMAAGALAASITRNMRLFASVAPRPSRVAILHDGEGPPMTLHRAAFDRNIAIDAIETGALISGAASRYQQLIAPEPRTPLIQQALKAYEAAGGRVAHDPAVLEQVVPDVRVEEGSGLIEARFLESLDAWLLVVLNHADAPQKTTLAFQPDIPEAIWVDMDTGASVTFVQTKTGPTLTETLPPRDVMLLVRSKRLR